MATPSVNDNELLYRQVGPGGNPIYFDPTQNQPVHQSVFLPTKKDIDGLSLIRSRFRTQVWSAYRLEHPTVRFRLALLQVVALNQLAIDLGIQGLNYLPTPDGLDNRRGEPWAHCVVTKINRTNYDVDQDAKRRIKEWALGVASLITDQNVVGPFAEPTEDDEYRPANE